MWKAGSALLALGLIGCSSSDEEAAASGPGEGSFSALTYNVAGLPQGISGSDPADNMPLISPLLNAYDLVLVQEDFFYHAELAKDARHPHQSEPKAEYERFTHDGLNRFSQFPWPQLLRVQWVDCYGDATTGAADCMAEKGFSLARTRLASGIEVDIYNHHGEAGSGPEDGVARIAGFEQFAAYIQEHSAGRAVIVGGDTNLRAGDPERAPVLEQFKQATGLTDVCDHVGCGDDHIDRFFFRDGSGVDLDADEWAVAEQFVDASGNPLSDHPAIEVRFVWRTR